MGGKLVFAVAALFMFIIIIGVNKGLIERRHTVLGGFGLLALLFLLILSGGSGRTSRPYRR